MSDDVPARKTPLGDTRGFSAGWSGAARVLRVVRALVPPRAPLDVVLLRLAGEPHERALALEEEQVVVDVEPLDQGVDRVPVADAAELHRGARLHQRHRVLAQDVA